MPPWHGFREPVFVVMRAIDAEAEAFDRAARRLDPPPGTLAVGGAAFDERLKCEALRVMLRWLNQGSNPTAAAAAALEDSRELVRQWNRAPRCVGLGGIHTVQRWEDTCAAMLDDRARRFAAFGDPVPEFEL